MAEGVEQQKQKQSDLVAEGQKEAKRLYELGFENTVIPADVRPFRVRGLKFQRLNTEHKFDEAAGILEPALTKLLAPAYIRSTFDAYKDESDVETKEKLGTQVAQWVYDQEKKKYGDKKL